MQNFHKIIENSSASVLAPLLANSRDYGVVAQVLDSKLFRKTKTPIEALLPLSYTADIKWTRQIPSAIAEKYRTWYT